MTDDGHGDGAEAEEHDRLKNVDPDGAAHAAEKDVCGHDQGDYGATEPVMNPAAADIAENAAATHDADNHVGHEHEDAQGEDDRADGRAFPTIAEKGDLGL